MLIAPCLALGQDSQPAQVSNPAPEASGAPHADAPDTVEADRTSALEEQVARQKDELAALRADLERRLSEESAARKADQAEATKAVNEAKAAVGPAIDAAVDAALLKSPRVLGIEGLTLSGFVQADMYVRQTSEDQLDTSTGAPLNDDRFAIKRLRIRASVDQRYLAAIAELDANTVNGPQARPMNVEVTAKLPGDEVPYVAGTVGIFKIPFGFEIGQSDYKRLFAERSNLEKALFPGEYDLGARIAGGWRFVRYALAVQNGEPMGESSFPTRDPNAAKDVVGRLGMTSALGAGVDIQAGFSALAGKGLHKGAASTKPTVSWHDTNEDGRIGSNELIPSPGSSGLPSQNFSRHALGADILVTARTSRLGNTTAYGEMTWAKNLDRAFLVADPYGPMGRDLRERGYYVALVQDLGKYVQAGIRYDYYDPDQDSTDRVAATVLLSSEAVSTFGMAVAARMNIGGLTNRLLLQYDINRNHAGRDQSGYPTNLASNAFTLRAEAVF